MSRRPLLISLAIGMLVVGLIWTFQGLGYWEGSAMTGEETGGRLSRHVTRHVVKMVARRLLARWGAGLVPFAGIAYGGWDMQRTADAVRALPLTLADVVPEGATLPAASRILPA